MSTPWSGEALDTVFRAARTHHHWLKQPVTDKTLRALYDLAKLGANGCPACFVAVRTPEAKQRLVATLVPANVEPTLAAPVTATIGYDLDFFEQYLPSRPGASTALVSVKSTVCALPFASYHVMLREGPPPADAASRLAEQATDRVGIAAGTPSQEAVPSGMRGATTASCGFSVTVNLTRRMAAMALAASSASTTRNTLPTGTFSAVNPAPSTAAAPRQQYGQHNANTRQDVQRAHVADPLCGDRYSRALRS